MTNKAPAAKPFTVLAIDGGAASGKSSTSRLIAERCHFLHVDTGSHYRAVSLACLNAGITPGDSHALQDFILRLRLSSRIVKNESLVCFEGGEPPRQEDLRSEAVNQTVSQFAALPLVRDAVKAYQRSQIPLARNNGFAGVVMDGRDIGTVILPDADLKVFLTADADTRQRRRELEGGADTVSARDRVDSSRATAPLRPAEDAVTIDNSTLSLEAVVHTILELLPGPPACP